MKGGVPSGVLDAYNAASHAVFVLQVPLVGLCFLGTFFIKDRGLAPKDEPNTEAMKKPDGDVEASPNAGTGQPTGKVALTQLRQEPENVTRDRIEVENT